MLVLNAPIILRLPAPAKEFTDPVETFDGTIAERDECTEVHTRSGYDSRVRDVAYYSGEQLGAAIRDCEVYRVPTRDDEYFVADLIRECDDEEAIHRDDALMINGSWYHEEDELICCTECGTQFIEGDDNFVHIDGNGYHYRIECHYCESSGDWELGEAEECEGCCHEEPDPGVIHEYHGTPQGQHYRGRSGYLVGFEVEKNSVGGARYSGNRVDECDLFAGWERDGSCGVEGITHCYDPIEPDVVARFKRHAKEAEELLASPCDSSCGGHINISSENHSPREMLQQFKVYAPLWYAMFRSRMRNTYCCGDKKLEGSYGVRYSVTRCKDFGIEIRLPSRVLHAEQLVLRFELVGLTCRAMSEEWTFNHYVKECQTLLLPRAYHGNRKRYAHVLRLARKFRIWLLDGAAHPDIQKYV